MQNILLRWISGAFHTMPIPWMEFLAGIPPVKQKANYMLQNALQRFSRLPPNHLLNHMATALAVHPLQNRLHAPRPPSNNVWLLKAAVAELPPMALHNPVAHIGCRLLDNSTCVQLTVPVAPPHSSKVFDQWAAAWIRQCMTDIIDKTVVGSDGSYSIKGQGVSAFVVQCDRVTIHSHSQLVLAHSSYDAEMHAAHAAIDYITSNIAGAVIMFIDNQAALKSLFTTRPHSLFELSRMNCASVGRWLTASPNNTMEFCWMPSHLGFPINELADKLAGDRLIGPPPFLWHTLASRTHHNRSLVVTEWQDKWHTFADTKVLKLKKKKKAMLPNVWDGKGLSD